MQYYYGGQTFYQKFLNNGIDIVIKGIADEIINDVIENINDLTQTYQKVSVSISRVNDILENIYHSKL